MLYMSKCFYGVVWSRFLAFINGNSLFKRRDRILAAVSGGADSVCLLYFLRAVSKKTGFEVMVCHVNHGLRGKAADADARFVKKLCGKLNIPFFMRSAPVKKYAEKYRMSLEHAARKARYEALVKTAKKNKCNKIAVGHQLDDHAETIILNLLRGTNFRGLLGIPVRREISKGITLVRPLLCVSRKEIMQYLRQNEISFRTDKSNESEKFTRNWVRKKLL
ncbi:MAG: tRNA lysidine(34) synthetase TilS, partial [Elusimicrobia bacterium]|nr:tRNA lysidine(34) synthetase TilS [Elusimicrobiota bacterium]